MNLKDVDDAIRQASVGKLTPEALYVHTSSLPSLPPLLQAIERRARALAGPIDGANLIKLHRRKPQVSFLSYPRFDSDAHPALATAVVVNLATGAVSVRDYRGSQSPPILHRKETFVAPGYPRRDEFRRLTEAEERAGLLTGTSSIGTRRLWQERVASAGYRFAGNHLVRSGRGQDSVAG